MILSPILYVLSYAPVVKVCGRTTVVPAFPRTSSVPHPHDAGQTISISYVVALGRIPLADESLYPAYKPVDWLIDNTPLREPLFMWAGICGVHDEFERGQFVREFGPDSE